jgi:hypothetical protein
MHWIAGLTIIALGYGLLIKSGPNGKAVPRFRRVTWKQARVEAEADRLLRKYRRLSNPTEAQRAELARAQMAAFRRRR